MPSPDKMVAGIIRKLPEQTGRSLQEWTELLERELPGAPFGERHEYLMREHELGRGQARTIIHLGEYESRPADDDLVASQYDGAKAALRPVYDAVVDAARALGEDVAVEPRRTYVSFGRKRQFALVQASTRTRVDLGVRLDDLEPGERLQAAGSFGSGNITHRIALSAPEDVDDEVRAWLRAAYEGGG